MPFLVNFVNVGSFPLDVHRVIRGVWFHSISSFFLTLVSLFNSRRVLGISFVCASAFLVFQLDQGSSRVLYNPFESSLPNRLRGQTFPRKLWEETLGQVPGYILLQRYPFSGNPLSFFVGYLWETTNPRLFLLSFIFLSPQFILFSLHFSLGGTERSSNDSSPE